MCMYIQIYSTNLQNMILIFVRENSHSFAIECAIMHGKFLFEYMLRREKNFVLNYLFTLNK